MSLLKEGKSGDRGRAFIETYGSSKDPEAFDVYKFGRYIWELGWFSQGDCLLSLFEDYLDWEQLKPNGESEETVLERTVMNMDFIAFNADISNGELNKTWRLLEGPLAFYKQTINNPKGESQKLFREVLARSEETKQALEKVIVTVSSLG